MKVLITETGQKLRRDLAAEPEDSGIEFLSPNRCSALCHTDSFPRLSRVVSLARKSRPKALEVNRTIQVHCPRIRISPEFWPKHLKYTASKSVLESTGSTSRLGPVVPEVARNLEEGVKDEEGDNFRFEDFRNKHGYFSKSLAKMARASTSMESVASLIQKYRKLLDKYNFEAYRRKEIIRKIRQKREKEEEQLTERVERFRIDFEEEAKNTELRRREEATKKWKADFRRQRVKLIHDRLFSRIKEREQELAAPKRLTQRFSELMKKPQGRSKSVFKRKG